MCRRWKALVAPNIGEIVVNAAYTKEQLETRGEGEEWVEFAKRCGRWRLRLPRA